MILKFR